MEGLEALRSCDAAVCEGKFLKNRFDTEHEPYYLVSLALHEEARLMSLAEEFDHGRVTNMSVFDWQLICVLLQKRTSQHAAVSKAVVSMKTRADRLSSLAHEFSGDTRKDMDKRAECLKRDCQRLDQALNQ